MADIGLAEQDRLVSLRGTASTPRRSFAAVLGWGVVALVDLLMTWQERAAARRHLSGLDNRLLADVGLSPADVAREAEKPFWRA